MGVGVGWGAEGEDDRGPEFRRCRLEHSVLCHSEGEVTCRLCRVKRLFFTQMFQLCQRKSFFRSAFYFIVIA